jgi:hypothetical protein
MRSGVKSREAPIALLSGRQSRMRFFFSNWILLVPRGIPIDEQSKPQAMRRTRNTNFH